MNRRHFLSALPVGMTLPIWLDREPDQRPLAEHTIADIRLTRVKLNWPRQVGKNARLDIHGFGPSPQVGVLVTDQGARGWGMTRGNAQALETASAFLKGKKLSDVFAPKTGVLTPDVLPFDFALHDLAGVILNQPVYELMGRRRPWTTKCYSGMIYFDDLEPASNPAGPDKILEECRFDRDYGYRQFKLKIGRGNKWMPKAEGLRRDIEVTKLVANAFPDCEILVDANDGFTVEQTTQYLDGIGGVDLFWIEEPFRETVADYRKLREYLRATGRKTLLADGEANPDPVLLRQLAEEKLLDVHLTDIVGLGFTPWRKLMPELKRMQISASPHAWGEVLKTHYTAHLAGAYENMVTIEGVTSRSDDVELSGYQLKNGKLIPPDAPGFGMKLLKAV